MEQVETKVDVLASRSVGRNEASTDTSEHPVDVLAGSAKAIQLARDYADLKNHTERLAWLEQPSPRWACGALVDAHTRHALIAQSRDFIARVGGGK